MTEEENPFEGVDSKILADAKTAVEVPCLLPVFRHRIPHSSARGQLFEKQYSADQKQKWHVSTVLNAEKEGDVMTLVRAVHVNRKGIANLCACPCPLTASRRLLGRHVLDDQWRHRGPQEQKGDGAGEKGLLNATDNHSKHARQFPHDIDSCACSSRASFSSSVVDAAPALAPPRLLSPLLPLLPALPLPAEAPPAPPDTLALGERFASDPPSLYRLPCTDSWCTNRSCVLASSKGLAKNAMIWHAHRAKAQAGRQAFHETD
jgi:hypothetical protein